jgi:hypothetical protein
MDEELPRKVEPYVVLTTVIDNSLANRLCSALEDSGVSVLLEHTDIIEDGERISAYKLLAPPSLKHLATRIISLLIDNYETRQAVTARTESIN